MQLRTLALGLGSWNLSCGIGLLRASVTHSAWIHFLRRSSHRKRALAAMETTNDFARRYFDVQSRGPPSPHRHPIVRRRAQVLGTCTLAASRALPATRRH